MGAALASGIAVWVLLGPLPAAVRLRRVLPGGVRGIAERGGSTPRRHPPDGSGAQGGDARSGVRMRRLAVVAFGASVAVVIGGAVGLAVGMVAGLGVQRWLATLEPAAVRSARRRTAADVPLAAELLRATLGAGAPLATACTAVAEAVGGPLGDRLVSGARALALGVAPRDAWSPLLADPVTARLGRLLVLTAAEGTAPAAALAAVAADVRADSRAATAARARALDASVAAPLGLCFLPGFLLLGVVPLVAAAATGLAL